MDSLILSHQSIHPYLTDANAHPHDIENGRFICQASDNTTYIISQNQISLLLDSQQLLSEPLDSTVSSVQYLSESNHIFISTITELYLFSLDSLTLENVGSIDSGIHAVKWSPDEELIIIITGNRTVLELNNAFQLISESPLDTDSFGEEEQVSIGWGKKSTQFHGSAGKAAAVASSQSEGISPYDDGEPRISWRGDGNFYCVSFINMHYTNRLILVFDRQGILQSTTEPVAQLESALDWRPSGNLIVSSQLHSHKHDIVFFERNGLRHGEFSIEKDVKVLHIKWNTDSTCLGICLENIHTGVQSFQLWTCMNYHWYLKQSIPLESKLLDFVWDSQHPLRLCLITSQVFYYEYHFIKDILTSASLSKENAAPVAVIDGKNLLLTLFKYQNVPPPMASHTLVFESPISFVSFKVNGGGNDFCVLLNDGTVELYNCCVSSKNAPLMDGNKPHKLGQIQLYKNSTNYTFRQVYWMDKQTLVAIAYNINDGFDSLAFMSLTNSLDAVLDMKIVEINYNILVRLTISHDECILVQDVDANVYQMDGSFAEESVQASLVATFPKSCPWMGSLSIGQVGIEKQTIYLGLSERNKLYSSDVLVSNECTSFFISTDFVILTTLSHTARFIPRHSNEFVLRDKEHDPFDEDYRRVEIGSRIVVSSPGDVRLVLQMPRGNLETICPRALVLSNVRHSLDKLDYKSAFILCRKHRIDLNLLIDHNPQLFYKNVGLFITQIQESDYINLVLSSLKMEDVTQTMYVGVNNSIKNEKNTENSNKLNTVCDLIRESLETIDPKGYLHSILTAFAKKSPPDLESAMRRILLIKDKESAKVAEDALKYLIFLADVNKLYDEALGMYDFPLVLMVAQHSQKDPREYLPFLNDLQKLEMYHQRYKIDEYLKRFEKALAHLALAGDSYFEDCLSFIQKHGLYSFSLTVFKSTTQRKRVLKLYADHLMTLNQGEEAGILYSLAYEPQSALEAYKSSLQWDQVFNLACCELNYTQEQVIDLAQEITNELLEAKEYELASQVILEYGKDAKACVEYLAKGNLWDKAIRIAKSHHMEELIESIVHPISLQALEYLKEDIKDMLESFEKKRLRLVQVREKKALKKLQLLNNNDGSLDNIDIMSDTSSMATTFISGISSRMTSATSASTRTSKLRRKLERKKAAGKGEAFEQDFLVESLKKLIEKSNEMRNSILVLLRFLCFCDKLHDASLLQKEFKNLLLQFEKYSTEIFTTSVEPTLDQLKQGILNNEPTAVLSNVLEAKSNIVAPEFSKQVWALSFLDSF